MFIVYDGENIDELRLVVYSDSDHRSRSSFTRTIPEDDTKRNRSTSGYVIIAGSIAISYNAKLQSRVVPSSKDAEFNAAFLCIQHMKKLQGLSKELGFPQTKTILFMDNLSVYGQITFQGYKRKEKQLEAQRIKCAFINPQKKSKLCLSLFLDALKIQRQGH